MSQVMRGFHHQREQQSILFVQAMLSDGTREVVKFKHFLSSLSLAAHCIYGMLLRLSSPRTALFEKPGGVSGASPINSQPNPIEE